MTTLDAVDRELRGLAEAEAIIARHRGRAGFSAGSIEAAAFASIERVIAAERPGLVAMKNEAVRRTRIDHLLGMTALGRAAMAAAAPADDASAPIPPVDSPLLALEEERKPPSERTLSPERRRYLLGLTPAGSRILADEDRAGRKRKRAKS